MIVETVNISNATIRVHDSSYCDKTKEEVQACVDSFWRVIAESLLRKEKAQ